MRGKNSTTEPPMLEHDTQHGPICWEDGGVIGILPVSNA